MDFKELLTIDKSLSYVISILVIFAVYKVIKHAPEIVSAFLEAFKNNTIAIDNSTEVIKDTKIMHELMKKKLDGVQGTLEELKELVVSQSNSTEEMRSELLNKIEKLEGEFSQLKKSGTGEGK